MAATGLRWEVVQTDPNFCYVVVVSEEEPEGMPVVRVHTGAKSRRELADRLEEVEMELEDVEAERVGLTRWCTLFGRAIDGLEDRSARAQAAAQTAVADPVYALQAWVPRDRVDAAASVRRTAGPSARGVGARRLPRIRRRCSRTRHRCAPAKTW